MIFGVPKEVHRAEHRVGLTPYAIAQLTHLGHQVYVERDAGLESHFVNEDYTEAGASIVYSPDEVFGRSDIICRVGSLSLDEARALKDGSTVCGFLHLAVASGELLEVLREKKITAVGYEILEDDDHRPILRALSEIAGQLVIHKGQQLLEVDGGGRGIVLGSVPGVPPATVVIVGAGVAGRAAASRAAACGAHVVVLDRDIDALRETMEGSRGPQIVTFVASRRNLARCTAIADLLIGAVNIPGAKTPQIVTEDMVRSMKSGSAIIDLSIDEGGCIETSRPTTLDNQTYVTHGVTHLCLPNMTTVVPRTASRALTLSALPYLISLAKDDISHVLREGAALARGLYTYDGILVNEPAGEGLGLKARPLDELL